LVEVQVVQILLERRQIIVRITIRSFLFASACCFCLCGTKSMIPELV
jgi:hypothetical protein